MGINYIIYLSETVALVLAWIAGIIEFKVKHKKGLLKFFGLTSAIFVVIFALTFFVERPEMEKPQIANIEVGSEKIQSPKTTYHFQDVTDKVQITGNIDYTKIGEYDIQFELDTTIGKYSRSAKIKVVDTTAPEIILEGGEEYKQSYSKEYKELGYKAIDKYEGDLTEKVETSREDFDETRFNIKYKVQDTSGNKAEKIRKVTIIDDVPPTITLNGNSNTTVTLNNTYYEKGAKAVDEKDGDLTEKITIEGTVNTAKTGTYTITYKVSDSSGNETTKTRTVVVVSKNVTVQAQDRNKW